MATWDKKSPLKIGDKIQVGASKLEIAGLLKYDPFNSGGSTNKKITLITSGKTFQRLTGVSDYSLVMIQTTKDATDDNIKAIRNIAGSKYKFSDQRSQSTSGTYTAFGLLLSKTMYDMLITSHFGYAVWSLPVKSLILILLLVSFSAAAAVYGPAKRIRNISVTETINEL